MRPVHLLAVLALAVGHASAIAQTASDPHSPSSAKPESPALRDLSQLLEPLVKKHDVPGMVAGIVVGDQLVAAGASGVRKRGAPDLVTLDDRFHIGSCTKAMTATLCAALIEKGTLRWDLTLAEAFPDLADRMHEQYKAVTLAQLLTNRAGVPASLDADGLWGRLFAHEGSPRDARRMLLEGVIANAPEHAPGTKFLYSNAGFAIAGHMAETVAAKPYEELMQEHLFAPLGMISCGWGPPGIAEQIDQPRGHRQNGAPAEPRARGADNPPAITPAGRLHCTLADWSKFVAVHLRGDAANPHRSAAFLPPTTFDKLHLPPDSLSDYSYGWSRTIRPWARGEKAGSTGHVLTHSGSNTMWFCVTWIAPERDFAVLVMCNQAERGDKACDEAAWALIQDQLKAAKSAKP